MTEPNFRRDPIRSRHYLDGSRGQPCVFQIPDVCTAGDDDTVSLHIRDDHTGRSVKASDLSTGDGCRSCHEVFDRRAKLPSGEYLSELEWLFYALRAMQRTIERRVAQGLLVVSQDVTKPFADRAVKPRKPKTDRAPIQSAPFPKQSRPLRSANTLRRAVRRQNEDTAP